MSGRLTGHGLRNEGRYYVPGSGYRSGGMAPGVCECGEKSVPLPSANARKRWHRDHKVDVRLKSGERIFPESLAADAARG